MAESKTWTHADYTIVWICALSLELAAAEAVLDEQHPTLPVKGVAHPTYQLGRVAGHNVVLACLPSYGTTSATAVALQISSAFPNVRYGLMVGIGGGVPSKTADIRLGDVIVSKPVGRFSGVVQYDLGKSVRGGDFQLTGTLNQPPSIFLTAALQLEAQSMIQKGDILEKVDQVFRRHPDIDTAKFSRPSEDQLFRATYDHPESEESCINCDLSEVVDRTLRPTANPKVHYGTVASGNRVIKDGRERDAIAADFDPLCFEMEAAGIMNHLPCLVIRGICDYCDSHKNKKWQGFAALVAAIYAKSLLSVVPISGHSNLQHESATVERTPKVDVTVKDQNASTGASSGIWMVPFNRNSRFLGREESITRIKEQIFSQNSARKAAISGLGGVGKTQIALEIAYQVRRDNADSACSVFWIPSTSSEAIEQAVMNINKSLGLSTVNKDAKSQLKNFLSSASAGRWLLIIDNADDADMWMKADGPSPALKTFLPQSPTGFTLFTTRNQRLATQLVGPDVIRLSELDEKTAIEMLGEVLVDKELTQDEESITSLVQRLCGLPLALNQAASFMNENCISPKEYLSLINEQEDTMIELLSEDFEDDYRYSEIRNPVASTWLVSFRQIQKLNNQAAKYLSFMACVAARDIPMFILPKVDSTLEQQKALGLLKSYAFVTEQTNSQLSMHRLVHLAIRNWLKQENELRKQIEDSIRHFISIFPEVDRIRREKWRQVLPHAQRILHLEDSSLIEARWGLVSLTGLCLHRDGRYHEAHSMFHELYEARQKILGHENVLTLDAMLQLSITIGRLGRYNEAESLASKYLEISKKARSESSLEYIDGLDHLANILGHQKRYEEAEKLLLEALDKTQANHEHDESRIFGSMRDLALIYKDQGRLYESEKLCLEILERFKGFLEPDDPGISNIMSVLAAVYRFQGRFEESEKLLIKVAGMDEARLGKDHPHTLTLLSTLANLYYEQNRLEESEKIVLRVLDGRKRVLGEGHSRTLSSLNLLAGIYWDWGWREARDPAAQSAEVANLKLDIGIDSHQRTACDTCSLASIRKENVYLDKAITLLQECVELQETYFGASHPTTIKAASKLKARQRMINEIPPSPIEGSPDQSTSSSDAESEAGESPPNTVQGPSKALGRQSPFGNFHPLLSALKGPISAKNTDDDDID